MKISISDSAGEAKFQTSGSYRKGFHQINWDTSEVKPGNYKVSIETGDIVLEKTATVLERWKWSVGNVSSSASRNPDN